MQYPQSCLRVGNGIISKIHQEKLDKLGVRLAAVVDTNSTRCREAICQGYRVLTDLREASYLEFDFWDICVSTSNHFHVMEQILSLDPKAKILVEKPICYSNEISILLDLLTDKQDQIVINETYCSSQVVHKVAQLICELQFTPERIVVEMSKNRVVDVKQGRFLDLNLGALGYEGSHLLTVVAQLGQEYLPREVLEVRWESMPVPSKGGIQFLDRQGGVEVKYCSWSGVPVELYSSMIGKIKHRYFPFENSTNNRYRAIAVEGYIPNGDKLTIVGFFEPVEQLNRGEGAISLIRNGNLDLVIYPIADDHMGLHLERAVRYFRGEDQNPCSVEHGVQVVKLLNEFFHNESSSISSIRSNKESLDVR
jgi:predicted dehydrogenase